MPQYNVPALITSLVAADIILAWQTAAGANKTITFADFVDSIEAEFNYYQTTTEINGNTVLDDTYQLVVANSGSALTVTLPAAVNYVGKTFSITNIGAGTVTVERSGSDTIGSATSVSIVQYKGSDFKAVASGIWIQMGT